MSSHPKLNGHMRAFLVNWLAEVVEEHALCTETLHLAAKYLDVFLSSTTLVVDERLQLVGAGALMLAA